MSSVALTTIGSGRHEALLRVTGPTMQAWADCQGWTFVPNPAADCQARPAAWAKIPAVRGLLQEFETVIWIDADAIVLDPTADLLADVDSHIDIALVRHEFDGHEFPNTGVVVFRRGAATSHLLDWAWHREHLIDHPLWDNAAVLEALGYSTSAPFGRARDPQVDLHVQFIDARWNVIRQQPIENPIVRHYAGEQFAVRLATIARDLGASDKPVLRAAAERAREEFLSEPRCLDEIVAHVDQLNAHAERIAADRDAAITERDVRYQELLAALAREEELRAQLEAAQVILDELQASASWKLTAPLRRKSK